jgi:hypothetical protein
MNIGNKGEKTSMDCHGKIKVQRKVKKLVGEVRMTTSVHQQLMATLLNPWKPLFGSGKKKKTRKRKSSCTTKLPTTKSTRVGKKTTKLCHTTESRLLARQLPLLQKEATGPSLTGSSSPIINWSIPMHQTNVATSSFLSSQLAAQTTTTIKTQQQEQ